MILRCPAIIPRATNIPLKTEAVRHHVVRADGSPVRRGVHSLEKQKFNDTMSASPEKSHAVLVMSSIRYAFPSPLFARGRRNFLLLLDDCRHLTLLLRAQIHPRRHEYQSRHVTSIEGLREQNER